MQHITPVCTCRYPSNKKSIRSQNPINLFKTPRVRLTSKEHTDECTPIRISAPECLGIIITSSDSAYALTYRSRPILLPSSQLNDCLAITIHTLTDT